jgi:hypothetical protein
MALTQEDIASFKMPWMNFKKLISLTSLVFILIVWLLSVIALHAHAKLDVFGTWFFGSFAFIFIILYPFLIHRFLQVRKMYYKTGVIQKVKILDFVTRYNPQRGLFAPPYDISINCDMGLNGKKQLRKMVCHPEDIKELRIMLEKGKYLEIIYDNKNPKLLGLYNPRRKAWFR